MIRRISILFALASVALAGPAAAQTITDDALTLHRTATIETASSPHGLAVDPDNGDVYFIDDSGRDLSVLRPNGDIAQLVNNGGTWNGQLTDLRFGPDNLIYAIGGSGNVEIQRFERDGTPATSLATIANGGTNAFGYDFDAAGNLYASDTGDSLYRITPAGEVSVFSTGWVDIDEIVGGPNNRIFVHDGSGRGDAADQVFLLDHNGALTVYAEGLGTQFTGAYDWTTGDYYVGQTNGELYRLRDLDNSGTIEDGETTLVGSGFTYISNMSFGRSSDDPDTNSLYLGSFNARRIWEIKGLGAWNGDRGDLIDDDADGFCENGVDNNDDGDCLDDGEAQPDSDCDDAVGAVSPDAVEVCDDGVDNNCDGLTDADDEDVCADVYDGDDDGFCPAGRDLNDDGDCADLGEDIGPFDCDDDNPDVFPGTDEICNDGIDNNCDGATDTEDDLACGDFIDDDEDGYCETGQDLNNDGDCADGGESDLDGDCNDSLQAVNPGADEVCGDGIDNDCNELADLLDPACLALADGDDDGFCPGGEDFNDDGDCFDNGEVGGRTDCDDERPDVNPEATELCADGIDNDCDGGTDLIDDDCERFVDGDNDGYCPGGADDNADGDCIDEGEADGPVDCNDANPDINPGQDEVCTDRLDNDCNGLIDELDVDACGDFLDGDDDGFCVRGTDLNDDGDCTDPGERAGPRDCNDNAPAIFPGAEEVCFDGVDNDCDALIDTADTEECSDYVDNDDDGWCEVGLDLDNDGLCLGADERVGPEDCNDGELLINPGVDEICMDGVDNDCNGFADERDEACADFVDGDDDGFCLFGADLNDDGDCLDPEESNGDSDCDDDNAAVHPNARELCADEIDNDCDGDIDQVDEDCSPLLDGDGDGYCPGGRDLNDDGDCIDPGEAGDGDCNDDDAAVNPGADEVCTDGVDNDCDNLVDEGDGEDCADYIDADTDRFCVVGRDLNFDGDCTDADEFGLEVGDCNDGDANIHPDADEVCTDGVDNDCNDAADESDSACADGLDTDSDGYCIQGQDLNADGDCLDADEQVAPFDCAPDNGAVNPAAEEVCEDGLDNDCDGMVDNAALCGGLLDLDGDGFCEMGIDQNDDGDCLDEDEGTEDLQDCDEENPDINPGAEELCFDEIDNDCDEDQDTDDSDCDDVVDRDADGYCPGGVDLDADGFCLGDELTGDGDCDDDNPAVRPGAAEVCGDGLDNDCDGDTDADDADCGPGNADSDGDGFCMSGTDLNGDGDCDDDDEGTGPQDCNDEDPAVFPGAEELCDDDVDNNCNGATDGADDNCDSATLDGDGDGWCPGGVDLDQDGDCRSPGEADGSSDCDDTDPALNPGAEEICDGIDNDCSGTPDDGGEDLDSDGVRDDCDEDRDGDQVNDDRDLCPDVPDREQRDSDGDGIGDLCDTENGAVIGGSQFDDCNCRTPTRSVSWTRWFLRR